MGLVDSREDGKNTNQSGGKNINQVLFWFYWVSLLIYIIYGIEEYNS